MPRHNELTALKIKYAVRDLLYNEPGSKLAIRYIKDVTGIQITKQRYNQIKKELLNDPEMAAWIDRYVGYGYIVTHRRILEELEILRDMYWSMINSENECPQDSKDPYLLKGLMKDLREIEITISQISLGTPVLAQMKKLLDHYKQLAMNKEIERLNNGGVQVYSNNDKRTESLEMDKVLPTKIIFLQNKIEQQ